MTLRAKRAEQMRENFEQVVTDILVALADWTDLPDGPTVDDAREAVMRELIAYAFTFEGAARVGAARADERQRIVERLLHAANVVGPDEVSRTALTLEKMAALLVAEGPA